MTPRDNDVDTLIREALSREEAEFFDRLGEPSVPEMLSDAFRGRHWWLNVLAGLLTLAAVIATFYCAVRFFGTTDLGERLSWGIGIVSGLVFTMALKVWYWMEMQRNALTREIKRLELQVAHLAGLLKGKVAG